MATSYQDKLSNPKWQAKRLLVFERDEFTCQLCGDKESTLHVHHQLYEHDAEPWEHSDDVLVTLCYRCHAIVESLKKMEEELTVTRVVTHPMTNKGYFICYAICIFESKPVLYVINFYDARDIQLVAYVPNRVIGVMNGLIDTIKKVF